jgi:VWFA-related protein
MTGTTQNKVRTDWRGVSVARSALAALVVCGAVLIAAEGPRPGNTQSRPPTPPQQQPPVFRSRVDLVQVDVSVLDERRMPVRGLRLSDFSLFEDGAPREIVAFTEMTASEPEAPPESWLRRTVPDVTVNNAEDGRLLLIIMDDARTPLFPAHVPGGPAIGPDPRTAVKQVAHAIVERMGPSDLAAIIFTVKNKGEQEFTSDRTRLFRAIDGFEQAGPGIYNAMLAMSTFGEAAKVLGSIPNRRKAAILISPSAPPVIHLEIAPFYVVGPTPRPDNEPSINNLAEAVLLQDAARWALRGNVTFYNVNPMRLNDLDEEVARLLGPGTNAPASSTSASFARPTAGLPPPPRYYDRYENRPQDTPLDQLTGGFSIRTAEEFASGITQIFRESGSYYLLGYTSPTIKDDGKPRRIEVRLNNLPHAVRSRAAFVPAKAERERPGASPLWTAIAGLTPAQDIALRVNVAPFAIPGKKEVALVITLGLRQPIDIRPGPPVKETVSFLTQAYSTNGDRRGSPRYHTVSLDLRPNPSGEVKYEVLSRLDLKPGRYHVRMSAQSRLLGRSGSIYHDIEIPDFSKAPLALSGVVISTTPPLVSGPRELLASLLPAVPTTQREFAGHQGSAFMRIYEGGKTPIAPVSIDVRIVDRSDQVAFERTDTLAPDRFDRHRAADYQFALPIDRLSRGTYLLTFRAANSDGAAATREVRFVVRASAPQ